MPVYIRDKIKILFIHVPKTGGTSIEHFFIRNGFGQFHYCTGVDPIFHVLKCSYQHFHAELLKAIFKLKNFDLIFMCVRHPLNRLISEYRFRNSNEDFNQWVIKTFERYQKNPYIYDNHIRPQNEFEVEGCKIFKLEDGLENVIEYLSNTLKLNFNYRFLPQINVSKKDIHIDIQEETKSLIYEFYKEDFLKYGYQI